MQRAPAVVLVFGVLFLASCSVARLVNREAFEKPTVRVESASLQALSFTGADLLVVLQVRNPNPVGMVLSGVDYELRIDGEPLVSGSRGEETRIQASGTSRLELPLRVVYRDMFKASARLLDRDRPEYQVSCGVSCRVPVLGEVRIPVTAEGTLPVLRLPSVGFAGLEILDFSLSGARVALLLDLDNPGGYPLEISSLAYELFINGDSWASGRLDQAVQAWEKETAALRVPVDLDFARIGRGARSLLSGDGDLEYRVEGIVLFRAALPRVGESSLVGETRRRFSLAGTTSLRR